MLDVVEEEMLFVDNFGIVVDFFDLDFFRNDFIFGIDIEDIVFVRFFVFL